MLYSLDLMSQTTTMPAQYSVSDMSARFQQKSAQSEACYMSRFLVHQATFQAYKSRNEDRAVAFECDIGLVLAIFDGHYTDELSDYASKTLPRLLSERISAQALNDNVLDAGLVTAALVEGIQEYDKTLIDNLVSMFPKGYDEDWAQWDDADDAPNNVFSVIGVKGDEDFEIARRAVIGTTALVAFIDKKGENVWVASLGDSEARTKNKAQAWDFRILNEYHNAGNPVEVQRVASEHPNEPSPVYSDRLLHCLAVTRALGDFQTKVPFEMATNVLRYVYPSPVIQPILDEWVERGHMSPPYMSSTPAVRHHKLEPGNILVLASDGFASARPTWKRFENEERAELLVNLAGVEPGTKLDPKWQERIGHSFIEAAEGDNVAMRTLKNVIFGVDEGRMVKELMLQDDPDYNFDPYEDQNDDMSIIILKVI